MRRNLLFLILSITFSGLSAQSEITLDVDPDTNIIKIGEQFNLTINVKHPKQIKINFPQVSDFLDQRLEMVEMSTIDTISKISGNINLQQKLKFTSFDTGIYQIPPLPFEIELGNRKDTLYSNIVPVLVLTLQLDTSNNIFDIKSQYPMKFKLSELGSSYILIIFLSALLILVLTMIYLKSRKKNIPGLAGNKPQIPAHVIALKELDDLKAEKLWQQNKIKEFYTRLTEIIRHYIELRFGVMALEQTSTEIIEKFIKNKMIDEKQRAHLQELLSLADLVKFAKGTALPDENERNMESAYEFVRNTKLVVIIHDDKKENEDVELVKELNNNE